MYTVFGGIFRINMSLSVWIIKYENDNYVVNDSKDVLRNLNGFVERYLNHMESVVVRAIEITEICGILLEFKVLNASYKRVNLSKF